MSAGELSFDLLSPSRTVDWVVDPANPVTDLAIAKASCADFLRQKLDHCFGDPPLGDLSISLVSAGTVHGLKADLGFGSFSQCIHNSGEFLLLPPNQKTSIAGGGPFELTSAAFHWEKWETELCRLSGRPVLDFKAVHSRVNNDLTIQTLLQMGWMATSVQPESELFGEMVGSALMFRLLALSEQLPAHLRDSCKVTKRTLGREQLSRTLEYIHDQCEDREVGSLAELAENCDLSRFQFCRRFAASTGYTPSEYLIRLRVEAARHRILQGASIVNAAISAGFSDQAHLTRLFRRTHGLTPGQYRREVNGK